MPNETHRAPLRYNISDFFSSLLDKRVKSKKDLSQVLKELNISRQEAARYLVPYRLTKAAKRTFTKVNAEDFWSLAESFGRKNIKAYIELDVDRKTMVVKWFDRH